MSKCLYNHIIKEITMKNYARQDLIKEHGYSMKDFQLIKNIKLVPEKLKAIANNRYKKIFI